MSVKLKIVLGTVLFLGVLAVGVRAAMPQILSRTLPEARWRVGQPLPVEAAMGHEIAHHFLRGFNTMVQEGDTGVADRMALATHPHFRPFFLEGASAGWIPGGWFRTGFDLTDFYPRWVQPHGKGGSGAWIGVGLFHALQGPSGLRSLAEQVPFPEDPFGSVRAWDGVGFKSIYVHHFEGEEISALDYVPPAMRPLFWQGVGRGLLFRAFETPGYFQTFLQRHPEADLAALHFGRAFALAYTHVHQLNFWFEALENADSEEEFNAAVGGGAMAIHFRNAWDSTWLRECIATLSPQRAAIASEIVQLGDQERPESHTFLEWQGRVTGRAVHIMATYPGVTRVGR